VSPVRRLTTRTLVAGGVLTGTLFAAVLGAGAGQAAAQTDPTALVGEGGSFLTPVVNLLLNTDTGLAPLNPQYSDTNLDSGIADFVGSGPGQFDADFVVSERPLTSAEAATATANGRTFAYVPIAATPVALAVFAICSPTDLANNTLTPTTFCNNMPLTPAQVGEIVTHGLTVAGAANVPTVSGWNDSTLTQANGQPIPDPNGIGHAADLSPSAENSALMALLDSDPSAKADLDNALNNPANTPRSTSDTPDEFWPFPLEHAYPGGDEALLGHELTIESTTDAPSFLDTWGALSPSEGGAHDAFPLSAVWAGAPEGTPWNVPTAAIENADTTPTPTFVGPTEKAAAAAETGSGITLDPSTNLVTFNPQPTNAAAYNNYLMVESYLVVPTSGLASAQATKLAQFIRYALGPTGQSDIAVLGAAPATAAEVTAGLKVASELDAEATSTASSGSSSSSAQSGATGATGATATTAPGTSSSQTGNTGDPSTDATSSDGTSAPTLASTGAAPLPIVLLGSGVVGFGAIGRWRLRRRIRT
jgi:ABC-type phosphate transport system substrate-binding protein